MRKCICLLSCIFILTQCGCAQLNYSEEITTLRALSESGSEIEEYLQTQEDFFYSLRDDLIQGRLKKGVSQRGIIETYGEPISSQDVRDSSGIVSILLYRHPTRFFTSDRIYLCFDSDDRLVSWEHKIQE